MKYNFIIAYSISLVFILLKNFVESVDITNVIMKPLINDTIIIKEKLNIAKYIVQL